MKQLQALVFDVWLPSHSKRRAAYLALLRKIIQS
jgi:hypothetical protein